MSKQKVLLLVLVGTVIAFAGEFLYSQVSEAVNGVVTPPLEIPLSKVELNELTPIPR
ncbi:hypothetical protein [Risungbinella massiliensis]|uniref:hypothetical protein n=1 Tax=Risungbinella massiliensis TaxID=1329796 RepID=UPI0012B54F5C|nr:hypothetical protein [Risungbinella massiliensis]